MAFTVVQKLDKDPKDITPDYTLDTLGAVSYTHLLCPCRRRD